MGQADSQKQQQLQYAYHTHKDKDKRADHSQAFGRGLGGKGRGRERLVGVDWLRVWRHIWFTLLFRYSFGGGRKMGNFVYIISENWSGVKPE